MIHDRSGETSVRAACAVCPSMIGTSSQQSSHQAAPPLRPRSASRDYRTKIKSLQQVPGPHMGSAIRVPQCDGRAMRTLKLSTVAAVCALGTVICFVVGAAAMGSSGAGVLIPETGRPGQEWIANVDAAGWLFFAGAWLIILMGFLGIVALVGFYDTLQSAGPVMILAPTLGAVGLTLVTVSHLIPIAMGYELVPAYVSADPAGQATLGATADTLAAIALVTNAAGNFLNWGVVVPLYAVAILTTRALPRWIGWLGLLVGALAGWLGLVSPASSVIASISNIGFIGFFVFMLTMGIALLRGRSKIDELNQASTQTPS